MLGAGGREKVQVLGPKLTGEYCFFEHVDNRLVLKRQLTLEAHSHWNSEHNCLFRFRIGILLVEPESKHVILERSFYSSGTARWIVEFLSDSDTAQ
jgi:hypothetical protein